jgi:steroid delta-isomerase-like uncharacterized protein
MGVADATVLAGAAERYFAAWNGRERGAIDDVLADEFTWVDPLLPGPLDNLEGAYLFLEGSWEGMPDLRFELIGGPGVDEAGGRVTQEWRMLGTHTGDFLGTDATGNTVDLLGADVFTIDADGRVTEVRAYYDAGSVLRQLGLG